jgi:SAM-dependent methyltransferase
MYNPIQWNDIIPAHEKDLEQGKDITHANVIVPYIQKILKRYASNGSKILDVGCGGGYLTSLLSKTYEIEGIDIAPKAIQYAKEHHPGIVFNCCDVSTMFTENHYDIVLASMLLHNLYDLNSAILNIRHSLVENGIFLAVLLHPLHWANEKLAPRSFNYLESSTFGDIPFHIYSDTQYPKCPTVSYYHRPRKEYISVIERTRFAILHDNNIYEARSDGKPVAHLLGIVARAI